MSRSSTVSSIRYVLALRRLRFRAAAGGRLPTTTLIAIGMTIAGLYWALGHATGEGEDVMAKLIRKVLYVGAFAYIIGSFNWLAGIVFRSFVGLGLTALSMETFLQPGRLVKTGIDAGAQSVSPCFLWSSLP